MPVLIEREEQLDALARELGTAGVYHLDTEFDSRAARTTLCLVQLCAEGEIYVIDTLALPNLRPLAVKLGDTSSTWVIHGAHQDIPLLRHALGLTDVPQLFDTQIAWGLASPEPAASFSYLNFKLLGLRSSKQHQGDDWLRRPLTHSQIAYAAHDVETLPSLHSRLRERLVELGRESLATVACRDILCAPEDSWEPLSIESFRNAWQLEAAGQRALHDLIEWYNSMGPEERRHAPEPKLLWSLANRLPKSLETLRQVRGLPRNLASSYQQRILSIMRSTERAASHEAPLLLPPPYATFERLQLDAWLEYVRCVACAKAQVAKELVLGGQRLRKLRDVVSKNGLEAFGPAVLAEIMGQWRAELLGDALRWAATRIEPPSSLQ